MTAIPKLSTRQRIAQGFTAFVASEDEQSRDAFVEALEPLEAEVKSQVGGIKKAIEYLTDGNPSPPLLVVDIENSEEPLDDLDSLADVCEPGTSVVVIGKQNDVNLFRTLIGAGVTDYLVKPIDTGKAAEAVANATRVQEGGEQGSITKPGKMVVFVGTGRGAGCSTLAINVAWLIAQRPDQRVALIDLDLLYGTSTFAFDLEPGRGMRDALENPDRVDSLFISSVAIPVHERLHIFGSEEPLEGHFDIDSAALDLLVTEVRHEFKTVIVDLPRHEISRVPELLRAASPIYLVSELSLVGMRDTVRLLDAFKKIAPEVDTHVIVNRVPVGSRGMLKAPDFEKGIKHSIAMKVPEDMKSVLTAANAGRPLAVSAKSSKTVAAMRDLAQLIAGDPAVNRKRGWRALLGKS